MMEKVGFKQISEPHKDQMIYIRQNSLGKNVALIKQQSLFCFFVFLTIVSLVVL